MENYLRTMCRKRELLIIRATTIFRHHPDLTWQSGTKACRRESDVISERFELRVHFHLSARKEEEEKERSARRMRSYICEITKVKSP